MSTECENVYFLSTSSLSSLPHSGCFISVCFLIRLAAEEKVEVGRSAGQESGTSSQGLWLLSVTLSSLREEPAVAPMSR